MPMAFFIDRFCFRNCKFILIPAIMVLSACSAMSPKDNLGDAKIDLMAYEKSGQYDRDFTATLEGAEQYIIAQSGKVRKPAIVLDIDETSLSNWPELKANDLTFVLPGPCEKLPKGPCGLKAWQKLSKAKAFPATLHLYKAAQSHDVAIFFITGRDEAARKATEKNLRLVGYDHWQKLIMRPLGTKTPSASDYKAPQRKLIEAQGFTIIANLGDQPSDLSGGYTEKDFLVPNPFYRIP